MALVLCRTSRAFLPLGRRLLYRAPFASIPLKVTWDRAIALYDVLSRNNGVVGRIVRSLHGLEIWCRRLAIVAAPKGAHAFDLRSQSSKVFAWQASIVAACPALRAVSVEIQSTSEATAMHRALGPSMASLEDIKLFRPARSSRPSSPSGSSPTCTAPAVASTRSSCRASTAPSRARRSTSTACSSSTRSRT